MYFDSFCFINFFFSRRCLFEIDIKIGVKDSWEMFLGDDR